MNVRSAVKFCLITMESSDSRMHGYSGENSPNLRRLGFSHLTAPSNFVLPYRTPSLGFPRYAGSLAFFKNPTFGPSASACSTVRPSLKLKNSPLPKTLPGKQTQKPLPPLLSTTISCSDPPEISRDLSPFPHSINPNPAPLRPCHLHLRKTTPNIFLQSVP